MKKLKTLILAVCLTIVTVVHSAYAKELVLPVNFWEPFTGHKLSGQGFASQRVKIVLKSKGHKAEIIIMPWARILRLLKSGNGKLMAWFPFGTPL